MLLTPISFLGGIQMQTLNPETLRHLPHKEGLILQGCGGDVQEWLDGINDLLQDNGILLYGDRFEEVSVFRHNERTNLLFNFDGVRLDMGKLARWRLQTYGLFGGTWLSDYVENQLGGFVEQKKEKADCQLIGQDGNIFNLIGIASRTLRQNGQTEEAKEMQRRITGGDCRSYYDALGIIGEYVNITGPEEEMEQTF